MCKASLKDSLWFIIKFWQLTVFNIWIRPLLVKKSVCQVKTFDILLSIGEVKNFSPTGKRWQSFSISVLYRARTISKSLPIVLLIMIMVKTRTIHTGFNISTRPECIITCQNPDITVLSIICCYISVPKTLKVWQRCGWEMCYQKCQIKNYNKCLLGKLLYNQLIYLPLFILTYLSFIVRQVLTLITLKSVPETTWCKAMRVQVYCWRK